MGRMTIVVDNFAHDETLKRDWGFSAYIEDGETKLLFDLGNKPEVFEYNLNHLGIPLSEIQCLVISHSDYDHVGGLDQFLVENKKADIFVPQGFDHSLIKKMEAVGHRVVETHEPTKVCGRFMVTGRVDPSPRPEHSLYFKTDHGYWIVAGCSHPKVWNIVRVVRVATGENPYLYIGGYHFFRLFNGELEGVLRLVRESGVKKVAPCHCTGEEARERLRKIFGEDFIEVGVGSVLEFS